MLLAQLALEQSLKFASPNTVKFTINLLRVIVSLVEISVSVGRVADY
jgi:hypothetical protein